MATEGGMGRRGAGLRAGITLPALAGMVLLSAAWLLPGNGDGPSPAEDIPAVATGGSGEEASPALAAGRRPDAAASAAPAGSPESQDLAPPAGSAQEWVVGVGGDFATLREALEAAEPGATIRVRPGVYREFPLEVDRSVRLIGEGFPTLDGEDSHSILVVTADSVQIRGFHLRGAGMSHVRDHAAITVEESEGCLIEGNRLEDNFFGIYLARASGCRVRDNRILSSATREATSGNGIHLWDVERVQVVGNHVEGHRDGIYLEFARGVVIRDNVSQENLRYGLHFMFSSDSFYQENTFRKNGAGVAVMYSRNVVMSDNRFTENWGSASYGLLIKDVQDSLVERNLFRENTVAIFSDGSDRITFRLNRVERNGWAVKILSSSQDNLFTANNFIENTFDVTTNSRRNPNTFDGNHWSAYAGYDLSGDGVGEIPHRPVRLFSYIVERKPAALILLRSFFVEVLEVAERVLPVLTPETLVDENPRIREIPS